MRPLFRCLFLIGTLLSFGPGAGLIAQQPHTDTIIEDNDTVIRFLHHDGLLQNRPKEDLTPEEAATLKQYRAVHPPVKPLSRKQARHQPRTLIVNKDGIRTKPPLDDLHQAILFGTVIGYDQAPDLSTLVLSAGSSFWAPQFRDDSGATESFWPDILAKLEAQNPGNAAHQDPFVSCIEYLKKYNKEVFWSIRVNDTHDYKLPVKDLLGWKKKMALTKDSSGNPFLVGTTTRPPKYTRSNALNFSNSEVRKKFLLTVKAGVNKLARRYRLDGIELDFTRHTVLFKSVADGGLASKTQLRQITDLIRAIRAHLDDTAVKRGRPVLLMVRIPDSVEFCRAIGIDIEGWLKEGLIDMVVNSDYYVLTPLRTFSAFCHKYNVPYYFCLERRRIEQNVPGSSNSPSMSVPIRPELWRGEALIAWENGADGIYIFNRPMATAEILRLNLGHPEMLRKMHFPEVIKQTEAKTHSSWADPDRWARNWNTKH